MQGYFLRRLVQAVPLLIGISILVFALLQMTPGGPLAIGESTSQSRGAAMEQLARLRSRYGLDQPIYIQYVRWAGALVQGDWGTSFNTGRPVLEMIGERIPATLMLTVTSFILALVIAFPIGIYAAIKQYSWFDHTTTIISVIGIAMPSFWLGIMLIFIFSYQLDLLPSAGISNPRQRYEGIELVFDRARHLLMPVTILALISAATFIRYIRSSVLEAFAQDYVRTARAKGLKEGRVISRHVLKNAALPVVTIIALYIPSLFFGAVVTESVFAIPGIGRLFIDSADLRDYPVLMGILIIGALLVILSNLAADLLYGLLDPRISYQ